MNKKIALLGTFALCIISSQAQLLWKVTGNGLKHSSYLCATRQLTPIRFLDSIPGIYKAYNSCNVVVCEVFVNNIDAETYLRKASIMHKEENMQNLLTAASYKLVDDELKSVLKIGLKEVRNIYPALICSMYKTEIYKKRTGVTDDTRSDSYFQLIAEKQGKKVVGLETIGKQMELLLKSNTAKRQAEILTETIRQKEDVTNDMVKAEALYKAGKLNELMVLLKGTGKVTDMTPFEYTTTVDDRTIEWVKQLPDLMKESPCFITLDALNFPGENGLIKRLEKLGYKVKTVDN